MISRILPINRRFFFAHDENEEQIPTVRPYIRNVTFARDKWRFSLRCARYQ